jgi:hypothetical protein
MCGHHKHNWGSVCKIGKNGRQVTTNFPAIHSIKGHESVTETHLITSQVNSKHFSFIREGLCSTSPKSLTMKCTNKHLCPLTLYLINIPQRDGQAPHSSTLSLTIFVICSFLCASFVLCQAAHTPKSAAYLCNFIRTHTDATHLHSLWLL